MFDYVAGKADCLAYALPWEGTARLVAPHVTGDAPTCRPDEQLVDVRPRLERSRGYVAVVVNEAGVVLGRLDAARIVDHRSGRTAGEVMTEGPTSVRPSEEHDRLTARMRDADVGQIIVTFPDGRLHGLFERPGATRPPKR